MCRPPSPARATLPARLLGTRLLSGILPAAYFLSLPPYFSLLASFINSIIFLISSIIFIVIAISFLVIRTIFLISILFLNVSILCLIIGMICYQSHHIFHNFHLSKKAKDELSSDDIQNVTFFFSSGQSPPTFARTPPGESKLLKGETWDSRSR